MNKLYRFSPITTKVKLLEAIEYVADQTTNLSQKITKETYPISSLTIFAHYQHEFEELKKIVFKMGELKTENNGPFVKLFKPIQLPKNRFELLRIRQPDPYRMQVGCNDFDVSNYEDFKNKFINKNENLRVIKRPDYEMIEFFNPDFDVLAYVLSNQLL